MRFPGFLRRQCAAALFAGAVFCRAQPPGESPAQAQCLQCLGLNGASNTSIAGSLRIWPANDPEMKKLTAARMFDSVKNGKTRMPAFKDKLSDEQIREVIGYFRSQK